MVKVRVPATSANLGPGFDTLGLAMSLFLDVELDFADHDTIIMFTGEGEKEIEDDPENNLVFNAAKMIFKHAQTQCPALNIKINNSIPLGKGLGSSASAIVAGMYAANELIASPYSTEQILRWAVAMEGHADNIVPAVAGGLTTAMCLNGDVFYQKINMPQSLKIIIAVPDFVLATHKSRSVLPENLSMSAAIGSLQRACFLLASISNGDLSSIGAAMDDKVFQPLRKRFIPGFDQVIGQARDAGAMGAALSGAGPSIMALATSGEKEIGIAMQEAFAENNIDSKILYLQPSSEGVVLMNGKK